MPRRLALHEAVRALLDLTIAHQNRLSLRIWSHHQVEPRDRATIVHAATNAIRRGSRELGFSNYAQPRNDDEFDHAARAALEQPVTPPFTGLRRCPSCNLCWIWLDSPQCPKCQAKTRETETKTDD